jgi:hypothetical protein
MRDLLGGKGANVAEMTRILGAERVPAGFTITTEACVAYMHAERELPEGLSRQVADALARLEEQAGKRLGDPEDPLLVSVRSGARESMPGMMDTVLNLGLNDRSVAGLAERTQNPRFAWDSYRRFVQMFGNVVMGIEGERFEDEIKRVKRKHGPSSTRPRRRRAARLTAAFKSFYDFPQDPQEQLDAAIRAVFDSWTGKRAVEYRRINRIPDDWGTAVNVSRWSSATRATRAGRGSRSAATRSPARPSPPATSWSTRRARTSSAACATRSTSARCASTCPGSYDQLMEILRTLERHYRDMQDTSSPSRRTACTCCRRATPSARPGGGALRLRRRRRDLLGQRRGAGDDRRREARRAAAPDRSTPTPSTPCWPPAWRRRRAPRRARSCSPPRRPSRRRPPAATSSSCAVHRGRRRRGLPRRARDPHLRGRQGLARRPGRAWHGRPAVTGASELSIDLGSREVHVGDTVLAPATGSPSTARPAA